MVRPHTPAFAFVDEYLAGVGAFDVEIDKAAVGKNDPQAKAFHADLLDRFPFHHFKVQNSFRLWPYHDFECITVRILLQQRISLSN